MNSFAIGMELVKSMCSKFWQSRLISLSSKVLKLSRYLELLFRNNVTQRIWVFIDDIITLETPFREKNDVCLGCISQVTLLHIHGKMALKKRVLLIRTILEVEHHDRNIMEKRRYMKSMQKTNFTHTDVYL